MYIGEVDERVSPSAVGPSPIPHERVLEVEGAHGVRSSTIHPAASIAALRSHGTRIGIARALFKAIEHTWLRR